MTLLKRINLTLPLLLLSLTAYTQSYLPDISVKTTRCTAVSFKNLCQSKDTTYLITFWATWCMPCINELESLNELYPGWQKEIALRFVAISVDDSRTSARVNSFVKGKGWTFDVYLDPNNDLKRALNINDVPHMIIVRNGKVMYQKNGYIPGSEHDILNKIKSFQTNGEVL